MNRSGKLVLISLYLSAIVGASVYNETAAIAVVIGGLIVILIA